MDRCQWPALGSTVLWNTKLTHAAPGVGALTFVPSQRRAEHPTEPLQARACNAWSAPCRWKGDLRHAVQQVRGVPIRRAARERRALVEHAADLVAQRAHAPAFSAAHLGIELALERCLSGNNARNCVQVNSRVSDTTICSSGKTSANWIMRRRFFSPKLPLSTLDCRDSVTTISSPEAPRLLPKTSERTRFPTLQYSRVGVALAVVAT